VVVERYRSHTFLFHTSATSLASVFLVSSLRSKRRLIFIPASVLTIVRLSSMHSRQPYLQTLTQTGWDKLLVTSESHGYNAQTIAHINDAVEWRDRSFTPVGGHAPMYRELGMLRHSRYLPHSAARNPLPALQVRGFAAILTALAAAEIVRIHAHP
jgi:hypothetical protein